MTREEKQWLAERSVFTNEDVNRLLTRAENAESLLREVVKAVDGIFSDDIKCDYSIMSSLAAQKFHDLQELVERIKSRK